MIESKIKEKVYVIGRGNVASHLCKALEGKADVTMVNPHTLEELGDDAGFILISVKDDAIREVAEKLSGTSSVVAHTSGSTPIDVFNGLGIDRHGVFYPLQTFSSDVKLDYNEIPFFIEAESSETSEMLKALARQISGNVYDADSEKRKKLHLASVFACNFVNHLWTISDRILSENGLDFDMLRPLIKETTAKLGRTTPFEGQTGPAVRNDLKILDLQREQLESDPEILNIYNILSDSIINTHNRQK